MGKHIRRIGGIEPLHVSMPRELKSRPSTSPTHPGRQATSALEELGKAGLGWHPHARGPCAERARKVLRLEMKYFCELAAGLSGPGGMDPTLSCMGATKHATQDMDTNTHAIATQKHNLPEQQDAP